MRIISMTVELERRLRLRRVAALSILAAMAAPVFFAGVSAAAPAGPRFQQDAKSGMISPFKFRKVPLAQFVRAYADVSGKTILFPDPWDQQLTTEVTLLAPRPLSQDALTELFFETIDDEGYTVIDGPKKSGWYLERERDARDGPLPLYEMADVPATHRLITAFIDLKHAPAEDVARAMRSFMPANSRIIPTLDSRLIITDTGVNIRKVLALIDVLDIDTKGWKARDNGWRMGGKCPGEEHTIEKVVIENLELPDSAPKFTIPGQPGGPKPPGGASRPSAGHDAKTQSRGGGAL